MAAILCILGSYGLGHRRIVGKANDQEQTSHRFRTKLPDNDLFLNDKLEL